MVALLLILVVIWLEALQEAVQIRRLKRTQRIFKEAFAGVQSENDDIMIDPVKGEIIMKAKGAFRTGVWDFQPSGEARTRFLSTRSTLSRVLKSIDKKFIDTEGYSAVDYIEVLVVGHTDCIPFHANLGLNRTLRDNWDLSVLRAAALSRFFTEPCSDGTFECCDDGSDQCEADRRGERIEPRWRVLPAGRGPFEPTRLMNDVQIKQGECIFNSPSAEISKWLSEQRRVVVQIVPRMDKLLLQDMK